MHPCCLSRRTGWATCPVLLVATSQYLSYLLPTLLQSSNRSSKSAKHKMCYTSRYKASKVPAARRRVLVSPIVQCILLYLQPIWPSQGFTASLAGTYPTLYHTHHFDDNNNVGTRLNFDSGERSVDIIGNDDLPTKLPRQLLSAVDDLLWKNANFLDQRAILKSIDDEHARDVEACSSLPAEIDTITPNHIDYDRIYVRSNEDVMQRPIAIRTHGPNPVLNASSIQLIRSAAERAWFNPNSGATSRFTYQRKGNSEAHLNDLASADASVQSVVDEMLRSKVYPLIRDAFGSVDVVDDINSLRFCVYDSLVIRYNATEANAGLLLSNNEDEDTSRIGGAGQPLHRDLGLISVNIMLNSDEEFEGGGTFFENQFINLQSLQDLDGEGASNEYQPLKPCSPGHCLSHLSCERHAGSSTRRGVRDILVIFVTATRVDQSLAPMLERSARLKGTARRESLNFESQAESALCRATYQRLAIDSAPFDGEAWHYLGMALRDYCLSGPRQKDNADTVQQVSLDCLRYAAQLTPRDGRLFNNLGLSLGQIYMQSEPGVEADEICCQARQSYEKAALLHGASEIVGCDVGHEHDASILNHGLFVANLDQFEEAARILSGITGLQDEKEDGSSEIRSKEQHTHSRIASDALSLRRYCEEQAKKMDSSTCPSSE